MRRGRHPVPDRLHVRQRNLIHRDYGKNAYTFIRRSDGKAIRLSPSPGSAPRDPDWLDLFAKVRSGSATAEERQRFRDLQQERSRQVLEAPLEALYQVCEVDVAAPPHARILASVDCAACGEATMETRITRLDGQDLCRPCYERSMAGDSPVAAADAAAAGLIHLPPEEVVRCVVC